MSATSLLESAPLDEAAALRRVRRGDRHAYGMLYERHLAGARRVAGSLLRDPADVDDVVAEAFASAFAAMRRGRGPVDVFGPYIHSCVRNECRRSWSRDRGRIRTQGDDTVVEAHSVRRDGCQDEFGHFEENDVVRAALDAMPPRLRAVLWHTEVDDLSHATIARMTGSTPQAVAALAMRARRAFADRYLQAHLDADGEVVPTTECHKVRSGLAEVVRGTASARRCRATSQHLSQCSACAAAQGHLSVVNERLRTVPLFALVTGRGLAMVQLGAKARFLSWLAGPAVELAAAGGLALIVALAPAETAPAAATAPSTVAEQVAVAAILDAAPMTPVVIEPNADRAASPLIDPLTAGASGAATTAGAFGSADTPGPTNAQNQLRGTGDDLVAPTPEALAPAALAASGLGRTAAQPTLVTPLPALPILDTVLGALFQPVIGGAVVPALPLPPVALPEVTVAAEVSAASVATAIATAVPLPPVPAALESLAPIELDTPAVSVGGGAGSGQGTSGSTGANVGASVSTGSGSSSGSGSVDADVEVSVRGGGTDDEPAVVIETEIDAPIIGDVDPDVVIGGGGIGLLPGD